MFKTILFLAAICVAATGHPLSNGDSRILGGVEAPPGYATFMAALVFGETIKSLMCGGSIVSKRHILTAAHCIDSMIVQGQLFHSFRAIVGSDKWESDETVARLSNFLNHPDWNSATIKNDIGILFTTEELKLNDKVTVIALNFDWMDAGEESFFTGWGYTGIWGPLPEYLQLLYVNTISEEECSQRITDVTQWWNVRPAYDTLIELCTYHSIGQGACNSDSGGALVSRKTGTQIGVLSWGFPCARGGPDVFVRVSAFKDFLSPFIEYTSH